MENVKWYWEDREEIEAEFESTAKGWLERLVADEYIVCSLCVHIPDACMCLFCLDHCAQTHVVASTGHLLFASEKSDVVYVGKISCR